MSSSPEEDELCRLCLSKENALYPIFNNGSSELAAKILECTSIKIEVIEGVPSSICEICKSKLIICLQFIKQCHAAEEQIQKLYEKYFQLHKEKAGLQEIELIDFIPDPDETLNENEQKITQEEIEIIDTAQCQYEELSEHIDINDQVVYLEIIQSPDEQSSIILNKSSEIGSTECVEPLYEKAPAISTDPESRIISLNEVKNGPNENLLVVSEERKIINREKYEKERKNAKKPTFPKDVETSLIHTKEITSNSQNDAESTILDKQDLDYESIKFKEKSVIIYKDGIKKYKRPCPICGILQQNLKQHMNVHSGAKQHVCSFCNKAFSLRGNLNCHLNILTGNKPHKCDECDEAFGDPTALKMHKLKHSEGPMFKCDMCPAILKYRHSLQTHMRSHRNERKHACTYCEKSFVTSSALKKHIRTHTGDRPYKCDKCAKTFICAGHLNDHKKTYHTDVNKRKKINIKSRAKRIKEESKLVSEIKETK